MDWFLMTLLEPINKYVGSHSPQTRKNILRVLKYGLIYIQSGYVIPSFPIWLSPVTLLCWGSIIPPRYNWIHFLPPLITTLSTSYQLCSTLGGVVPPTLILLMILRISTLTKECVCHTHLRICISQSQGQLFPNPVTKMLPQTLIIHQNHIVFQPQ